MPCNYKLYPTNWFSRCDYIPYAYPDTKWRTFGASVYTRQIYQGPIE